jgi:hypothetical protein
MAIKGKNLGRKSLDRFASQVTPSKLLVCWKRVCG